MKKLFLTMMACMLVTSSAYAFESTITGNYFVRGTFIDTDVDTDANDKSESYYDQDLDIHVQINTDENTYLKLDLEARDAGQMDAKEVSTIAGTTITDTTLGLDVLNLSLYHKFGTGTSIEVGDLADPMFFGTGMTIYPDDGNKGFGLLVTQDMSFGNIYFLTEKLEEGDKTTTDEDAYVVGATMNFGDVMVAPRFAYISENTAAVDEETMILSLYATATFDALSLKGDFSYINDDNGTVDTDTFGLYVEGNYDLGMMTVGAWAMYLSVDDDNNTETAFECYDFNPLYYWGDFAPEAFDQDGVTAFALTASKAISDELTVNGAVAYGFSNRDLTNDYDAFEIDLGASYKITDALTYSVELAYAMFDANTADVEDTDVIFVANKLNLSF